MFSMRPKPGYAPPAPALTMRCQSRCVYVFVCALLAATVHAAEKKAPVTEPSSAQLEQRVANLEQQLQNKGLLDLLQQVQALQAELGRLRGQVETSTHELELIRGQQRKLYNDLDERLKKLEGKTTATTGAPVTGATPPLEVMPPAETIQPAGASAESSLTVQPVVPPAPAPETPATEQAPINADNVPQAPPPAPADNPLEAQTAYQQAFNLLKQAQYDKAISAFNAFLGKYPQSQYAENAQYWLGETYFVTRRYHEAITEYMKLVTNYPQSQKAPNSLLKIGYSYYELKQNTEAEKVLQDLIKRYPGTTAAQDAGKRLQQH